MADILTDDTFNAFHMSPLGIRESTSAIVQRTIRVIWCHKRRRNNVFNDITLILNVQIACHLGWTDSDSRRSLKGSTAVLTFPNLYLY